MTGLAVNLRSPTATRDLRNAKTSNPQYSGCFSLQPRLSIPFDGGDDVATVTSESVFIVRLNDREATTPSGSSSWYGTLHDHAHLQADGQLEAQTRYLLVVTGTLRDAAGRRVKAAEHFRRVAPASKRIPPSTFAT